MLIHDPKGSPSAQSPNRRRSARAPLVAPGDVLGGKFRVERVLGEGGMGVVALATQIHLDRYVALKIMRTEMAEDAGATERFLREARASSQLSSDHVARVL